MKTPDAAGVTFPDVSILGLVPLGLVTLTVIRVVVGVDRIGEIAGRPAVDDLTVAESENRASPARTTSAMAFRPSTRVQWLGIRIACSLNIDIRASASPASIAA